MQLRVFPLELVCWITAILFLAILPPEANHFTLCPFANIGILWCPGCGLGKSVAYLIRGDLQNSFQSHWLGIPVFAVLAKRIVSLIKNTYFHIA